MVHAWTSLGTTTLVLSHHPGLVCRRQRLWIGSLTTVISSALDYKRFLDRRKQMIQQQVESASLVRRGQRGLGTRSWREESLRGGAESADVRGTLGKSRFGVAEEGLLLGVLVDQSISFHINPIDDPHALENTW